MRDEAKTWWLVSGPNVASSYFFSKKIRVALESRTLIWVPLVVTITTAYEIFSNYNSDFLLLSSKN